MGRFGRWWEEVARIIFIALGHFIFGLIFTASVFALVARVLAQQIAILAPFKWHLTIVFASGGAWLFAFLFTRFSRHRPSFPKLNVDFHLDEKDISYECDSSGQIVYRKRVVLRALREGLDSYEDRYHWTGSGAVKMYSAIQDQTVQRSFRKTVWQYYEIRFPKVLAKGEVIETEIVWELDDSSRTSVPFVSAGIEEPTSLLKLNLRLPVDLGAREVICEVSSGIGTRRPFESRRLALDREGRVSWVVANPKLLYFYEMKWVRPEPLSL